MPEPIPSNIPNSFFDFQFHQVAIFCPGGVWEAVDLYQKLGYENWIEDHALLVGRLNGVDVTTNATMLFNYDIMPMELEFLHYMGPSRYDNVHPSQAPFISHMSVYTDDAKGDVTELSRWLMRPPFHRFVTQHHTNPGVKGKKRFIEAIFDTRSALGFDIKLIQKVPWDFDDQDWL